MRKGLWMAVSAAVFALVATTSFAQTKRALTIDCDRSGAQVLVNGRLVGATRPKLVVMLLPNTYSITVKYKDLKPFQTRVTIGSSPVTVRVRFASLEEAPPEPVKKPVPQIEPLAPAPIIAPAPAVTPIAPAPSPTPSVLPSPQGQNLALGKPVTSSSSVEYNGWYRVALTDGNRVATGGMNGWSSNANLRSPHAEWVELDLQTEVPLGQIRLYPRTDLDPGDGYPLDLYISVSSDHYNWTTLVSASNVPRPLGGPVAYDLGGRSARWVKIEGRRLAPIPRDGNAYRMQLLELEVYGVSPSSSPVVAPVGASPSTSIPVTFYWHAADTADVYINGSPIYAFSPDYRTRSDEAPKPAFSTRGTLSDGDIITVGTRRGGSYGFMLIAVDDSGSIVWKTDPSNWFAIQEPRYGSIYDAEQRWMDQKSPVSVNPNPWPPQQTLNSRFGNPASSVYATDRTARTGILISKVSLGVASAPLVAPGSAPSVSLRFEGESYLSGSEDIQREGINPPEGGTSLAFLENRSYAYYGKVNFGAGVNLFRARVASANMGGVIELRLGSPSGPSIGSCEVPGTGGWHSYTTVETAIPGAMGEQDLYLVFAGPSGFLFNINWFEFGGPSAMGGAPMTPTQERTEGPARGMDSLDHNVSKLVTIGGAGSGSDTVNFSFSVTTNENYHFVVHTPEGRGSYRLYLYRDASLSDEVDPRNRTAHDYHPAGGEVYMRDAVLRPGTYYLKVVSVQPFSGATQIGVSYYRYNRSWDNER